MCLRFIFIVMAMFFSGCASFAPSTPDIPKINTMNTDLYPHSITRSEYYRQMALSYHQENLHEKSTEYYKLSLIHNPNSVQSMIGLSDVYREQGHLLLAQIALEDAKKLDSQNILISKKLGDLYLASGIYSKARSTFFEILNLNNKNEEALWAVYHIYLLERKYEDALQTLAKVQATDANSGKIAYHKAVCHRNLKNYELYRHYLEESVKLDPRNKEAILAYAEMSYENEKFAEAKDALLNLSNTKSFDFEISQHLAYASVQAGFYTIALREFDKQIAASTYTAPIELKKAHVLFLMNDYAAAEKLYLKLAIENYSDEARFYLGQLYFEQKRYDEAQLVMSQIPSSSDFFGDAAVKLSLYNKYIGKEDVAINILHDAFIKRADVLQVYQTYTDFLIETKKYVEAVALLEKAIGFFPSDEELRLKMAYLHFRLNNQKSFKKQIQAALKINPQSAEAYAMLSELWYLKERSPNETIFFAKKALELKSRNKNVKPVLAWALMQLNRSTEAVAIFEEFYEENPKESFFTRSLSQVYSRGGVKEKAKKLDEIAAKLENDDSLKSRFIFRRETSHVNAEEFKESKTRLPASLENYKQ